MNKSARWIALILIVTIISCNDANQNIELTTFEEFKQDVLTSDFSSEPDSIRFNVADVEIAPELLKTYKSQEVFEQKIGKIINYFPVDQADKEYVYADNNVFIQTIQEAFDQHRPLLLSPDIIWLLICQGTSIHINENLDSLEAILFKKNKPKELVIRNDSLSNNQKSWENLISAFSSDISKYTDKKYHSFFIPRFSTTSATITTAFEINLMHTFKKTFSYVGESGCGIPSIVLKGNKKDWIWIKSNLTVLDDFGLKYWRIELEPIIDQFIAVYNGNIDLPFWKNIYKNMTDYNAFYISGWIIKFFPYLTIKKFTNKYTDDGYSIAEEKYEKNKFLVGDKYLLSVLSTESFPTGINDVEITWNNYFDNESKKLTFYSGFFAINQYEDKTIEPLISWAICEKDAKKVNKSSSLRNKELKIAHQNEYWVPYVLKDVESKPIFLPEKFNKNSESVIYLKELLKDSLQSNFNQYNFEDKKISFVVLINATVDNVEFNGDKDIEVYLSNLLKSFNGKWTPASTRSDKAFLMADYFEIEKKNMNVNYKIEIRF